MGYQQICSEVTVLQTTDRYLKNWKEPLHLQKLLGGSEPAWSQSIFMQQLVSIN